MATTLHNAQNRDAGISANGLTASGLTATGLTATGLTATGLTVSGRNRSEKSSSSCSPKRIQLEIFAKGSANVETAEANCESTHDLDLANAVEPSNALRFWSGASGAWKRVEKARTRGEATVIPQSVNPGLEVSLREDLQESVWKDPLLQAAGLISFVIIFLSGI